MTAQRPTPLATALTATHGSDTLRFGKGKNCFAPAQVRWQGRLVPWRNPVCSPFALHEGRRSVSVQHGIVGGFLHGFAVKLDGLSPLLTGKRLVGLQLNFLQVGR